MKVINERLKRLEALLTELKDESYSMQYGIADFVDTDSKIRDEMDKLAEETAMYSKVLDISRALKKEDCI